MARQTNEVDVDKWKLKMIGVAEGLASGIIIGIGIGLLVSYLFW
ncbi:hypothetical protein [Lactiplantibacillus plantarum]|nr:hypothetical protein [Lactiplantibacillus plantarum]